MFQKALLIGSVLLMPSMAAADFQCQGFRPETFLNCYDAGGLQRVHGFEEKSCGAGRDGLLNESTPIQNVDGPTWYGSDAMAEVRFTIEGREVTLKNCEEI